MNQLPNLPTKEEIEYFYNQYLEHGYFHGDQYRLTNYFRELKPFFESEFSKMAKTEVKLIFGSKYFEDWDTIIWFYAKYKDNDAIVNKLNEYVKNSINSSNSS